MLRFTPDTIRIVFFDLEYYTPPEDRDRETPGAMKFCPVLPGHKIIGGVFQVYYPMLDKLGEPVKIWEWELGSEEAVLKRIFDFLKKQWRCFEKDPTRGSLMLGGIGISRSDVPALFTRMTALSIGTPEQIFHLLYGCQQIDLSTATFCQFAFNHAYFAYPKPKSSLYQKYLNGKLVISGLEVLNHYDQSAFTEIESRTLDEIKDMVSIYKAMFDLKHKTDESLRRLKTIEKEMAFGASYLIDELDANNPVPSNSVELAPINDYFDSIGKTT